MSERGPKISVIIAAYNAEAYLEAAVSSVLAQDYPNLEVIIVDDGSQDATSNIISRLSTDSRIKSVKHPGGENFGPSYSRELGVQHSDGELVCFLDADDLFLAGKLNQQARAMEQHPGAVMCHTAVRPLEQASSATNFAAHFSLGSEPLEYFLSAQPYFLKQNRIANSSAMIRRSVLAGIPFGVRQVFQFEDWLLWLLLSQHGSFLYLPHALIEYRYHAQSATYFMHRAPLLREYAILELCLAVQAKTAPRSALWLQAQARLESALDRLREKYGSVEKNRANWLPERFVRALQRALGRV